MAGFIPNENQTSSSGGTLIESNQPSHDKFMEGNTTPSTREGWSEHSVVDPVAERRLVKKLDMTVLPLYTTIYTLVFLDRSSLGNAQIAGMPEDLKLEGYDLSIALTIFFAVYILAKIPSNLIVKHFGSIWIAFLVIGSGGASLGTAFITTFGGLILTRVFAAIAEGGILVGSIYLLARYYRRHELVLRMSVFFGLSPVLAGAFAGLVSSGLLSISDIGTITRWRKIFFVEGIITLGVGTFCLAFLPGDPGTTRLFTKDERELAMARIDADSAVKTHGKKEKTTLRLVLRSFNIWTCICAFAFTLLNISYQGMNVFLPTIISGLGNLGPKETQLRTVPPYLVGAVWMVLSSYLSSRWNSRTIPVLVGGLMHIVGYSIAISTTKFQPRYAACFIAYMGDAAMGVLFMTWGTDNAAPDTMRAVASAAIAGISSLGSITAMWTFVPSDAPSFRQGNILNLAAGVVILIVTIGGYAYLRNENARRDRGDRDNRLLGKSEEEIQSLGYMHPGFRYQL